MINAAWGLGECVVQGSVNPDQVTVRHDDLRVLETVIGHKTVRMVRNPSGKGAIEEEVPAADRDRLSVSDGVIRELADLGRRVQEYYSGIPQDLEWARVGEDVFCCSPARSPG